MIPVGVGHLRRARGAFTPGPAVQSLSPVGCALFPAPVTPHSALLRGRAKAKGTSPGGRWWRNVSFFQPRPTWSSTASFSAYGSCPYTQAGPVCRRFCRVLFRIMKAFSISSSSLPKSKPTTADTSGRHTVHFLQIHQKQVTGCRAEQVGLWYFSLCLKILGDKETQTECIIRESGS